MVPDWRLRILLTALLACASLAALAPARARTMHIDDVVPAPESTEVWRVRGEYLLWWTSGNPLPPLLTTSPDNTPRPQAGVLGVPGTVTLLGNRPIDADARSGARLTVTRWFESVEDTGLELTGFYVGDDPQSGDLAVTSPGSPILARPFINATTGQNDASLLAYPNVFAGGIAIDSFSETWSAAVLVRRTLATGPRGRIDFLGGYRYFRLHESLLIREHLESIDPGGLIPLGTTSDLFDRFTATSNFHGGEVGLAAELVASRLTVEFLAKVALGGSFRTALVQGQTTVTIPGTPPTVAAGGLLALPSNSGTYTESEFSFLPELGMNVAFAVSPNLSLLGGYTLIIVNDVVRSGAQIDPTVNTSQLGGQPLAGAARPAFGFHDSILVLQGLNVGLEYRW